MDDFEDFLEDSDYLLLLNCIDFEKFAEKYFDAIEYFKSNIYFEEMVPDFSYNYIQKTKDGYVILYFNKEQEIIDRKKTLTTISNQKIVFFSLDFSPLETLKIFFKKLERISEEQILRFFSPEDELLAPYHIFLEQTQRKLIRNLNTNKKIVLFLREYDQNNYEYSINIIGKTFEDYLIEIYETCFRERCPKGLTIGELYDLIEQKTNKLFAKKIVEKPDSKPIYSKINEKIEKISTIPVPPVEILLLLRELTTINKQNEVFLSMKIEEIEKRNSSRSIFPKNIKEDILDLLRYRNAISHKSRIPIGEYETIKSIYCFSCVILWWINEKSIVDWRLSKEDILKQLTSKNLKNP